MEFKREEFRKDVITKRMIEKSMSMDAASKEIGISKATLSRIESKKAVDMDTFIKVIVWLGTEPSAYFSIPRKRQDGFR
jgi:transcriptional regulator with XRE-family HTH domain